MSFFKKKSHPLLTPFFTSIIIHIFIFVTFLHLTHSDEIFNKGFSREISVRQGSVAIQILTETDSNRLTHLNNQNLLENVDVNKNLENNSDFGGKKDLSDHSAGKNTTTSGKYGLISELNHDIQNTVEYPTVAEELGWNGVVKLSVEIKEDGSVGNIAVLQPSYSVFISEAVDKIKKWKFHQGNKSEYIILNIEFINPNSAVK